MRLADFQRWRLTAVAGDMSYAAIVIGYGKVERTCRYVAVRSVASIWRGTARGGDVYRSRPTKTGDGIMRLAGFQRWGLADVAGDMSYAAIVIGHGKVERPCRYVAVRSVTSIWRSTARGGDVYRSRPTKTGDGIMRLAFSPRRSSDLVAGDMSYAAIVIGHGKV